MKKKNLFLKLAFLSVVLVTYTGCGSSDEPVQPDQPDYGVNSLPPVSPSPEYSGYDPYPVPTDDPIVINDPITPPVVVEPTPNPGSGLAAGTYTVVQTKEYRINHLSTYLLPAGITANGIYRQYQAKAGDELTLAIGSQVRLGTWDNGSWYQFGGGDSCNNRIFAPLTVFIAGYKYNLYGIPGLNKVTVKVGGQISVGLNPLFMRSNACVVAKDLLLTLKVK